MTLLLKESNFCLLDHKAYLKRLYAEVTDDSCLRSFELNPQLFCIKNKVTQEMGNRKRKYNEEYRAETIIIMELYNKFLNSLPNELKNTKINQHPLVDTKEVRGLSQQLFETTVLEHSGLFGGNNSDKALKCKIGSNYFLMPPNSRFFCGSVTEQCKKLSGNKYDIFIADPPWWNKYIRRLKSANDKLSYSMMYNEDIADIPVKHILASNCLVAVWCTNAPSNIDAVKNMIFPNWGVEYVTTWYWLKVTIDWEPLCPFSAGCKKQPYERLIIGKVGQINEVPKENLIISVPSALHSHKPPILDLLKYFIVKENPETLELFARYLLPNTTSVGYEPLKWQHMSLYTIANKDSVIFF